MRRRGGLLYVLLLVLLTFCPQPARLSGQWLFTYELLFPLSLFSWTDIQGCQIDGYEGLRSVERAVEGLLGMLSCWAAFLPVTFHFWLPWLFLVSDLIFWRMILKTTVDCYHFHFLVMVTISRRTPRELETKSSSSGVTFSCRFAAALWSLPVNFRSSWEERRAWIRSMSGEPQLPVVREARKGPRVCSQQTRLGLRQPH